MFKQQLNFQKRLPVRCELFLFVVLTVGLYVIFSKIDVFGNVIRFLRYIQAARLDTLFMTILGLFIALLIYRSKGLAQEYKTHRKVAEELARERILLRTVIDYLPDYIFVKDTAGKYVLTNIAHAKAVRALPEELIGKKAGDVFPPELAAQFDKDDAQITRLNRPLINAERTTVNEFDEHRSVLTTKIPLLDSNRRVIGLVGISRDITDRKLKQQQELELAQERERVKMMSLLTREAAHDFRTPLATINTSAYLMMRSKDPERQREHAHNIEQAIRRLSKLLDDLTLLSQLDSSNDLEMETVNINHLLRSLVAAAPSLIQHSGLQVALDLDRQLQPIVGATSELSDAFMNLIDNAAQFTPDGGTITIQTRHHADEVEVIVKDTGVGISPADLPHIFDRFFRTDRARSPESGGSGLGLSITRKIIELHHGRIEVESVEGEGSTFHAYLPISQPDFSHNDATRPSRY